jgi:hypothetical protein
LTIGDMNTAAELHDRARHLSRVARDLQTAAALPESSLAAPATMASLEEALQAISAGWYQLAADAASSVDGLSRARQVRRRGPDQPSRPGPASAPSVLASRDYR